MTEKTIKSPKQSSVNDYAIIEFDDFINEGLKAVDVHVVASK